MEKQFWENAWQDRKIGFHMSEYNKFLEGFIENKRLENSGSALVPLCGKTLDMILLKNHGLEVFGVEIAEQGVVEFFTENKLEYTCEEIEDFKVFKSKNITIFCGDIFKLQKAHIPNLKFIFDRAATVALPLEMRNSYFKKLTELSDKNTEMLLITMHSEVEDKIGPPFSVSKEEIEKAYKCHSNVFEVLVENKMKINSQRLRDQGVSERIMVAHHIKFK